MEKPRAQWGDEVVVKTVRIIIAANCDSMCPAPYANASITSIDLAAIETLSDRHNSHSADEEIEA